MIGVVNLIEFFRVGGGVIGFIFLNFFCFILGFFSCDKVVIFVIIFFCFGVVSFINVGILKFMVVMIIIIIIVYVWCLGELVCIL